MRAFDRDLIRGGHYGQRPCEPHLKAEHMAAPTNAANVKKVLVNSEPSTHGTSRRFAAMQYFGAYRRAKRTWQPIQQHLYETHALVFRTETRRIAIIDAA
jgi:hypothetical protein